MKICTTILLLLLLGQTCSMPLPVVIGLAFNAAQLIFWGLEIKEMLSEKTDDKILWKVEQLSESQRQTLNEVKEISEKVDSIMRGIDDSIMRGIDDISARQGKNTDRIVSEIHNASSRIEEFIKNLQIQKNFREVLDKIPNMVRQELRLNDLSNSISIIDSMYEDLITYTNPIYYNSTEGWVMPLKFERATLDDFASSVVSHSTCSLRRELSKIHQMVVPSGNILIRRELFSSLFQHLKTSYCEFGKSPRHLLHDLFSTIVSTEVKGYMLMKFSWMILKLHNKGNFTLEIQVTQQKLMKRLLQQVTTIMKLTDVISHDQFNSDPVKHVENKTFIILRDLQKFVTVGENLERDKFCSNADCAFTLGACDATTTSEEIPTNTSEPCCESNCEYEIPLGEPQIGLCLVENHEKKIRKETIQSDLNYMFRNLTYTFVNAVCNNDYDNIIFQLSDNKCNHSCTFQYNSDTSIECFFSVDIVLADTHKNMAITGLRFVKGKDGIIHFQIQQGKVLPYGEIDISSVHWKPIEYSKPVYSTFQKIHAFDLDDLLVPENHVLTGVFFKHTSGHIHLGIESTPLNFVEGNLITPYYTLMNVLHPGMVQLCNNSFVYNDDSELLGNSWDSIYFNYMVKTNLTWSQEIQKGNISVTIYFLHHTKYISNNKVELKTQLRFDDPDLPTKSYFSRPDSNSGNYIKFTRMDKSKDSMEREIPFIDIEPVITNPPSLLAGAGIHHRGELGFGGFIAPKLITYNYAERFWGNLSDESTSASQNTMSKL